MYLEKTISPQAQEDFLKNLKIPIKGETFSIHSIIGNQVIRLNNLPYKPYKSILEDDNIGSLISLVNTLTNGLLYSKYEVKNTPKKFHSLVR